MSGIFGCFFQTNIGIQRQALINAVKSEGYNVTKLVFSDSCILGGLDIKSAKNEQSIERKSGIRLMVCGEVCNEDIKDVDKWILTLYEQGKLNLLRNLNGSFAVAIYDNSKEKLTIANDRYGLIKLFYYHDKNHFYFAPKIKPLIRLGIERTLRKDAIIDFFLFGYLLGDKTFFKHIYQLPPASIMEISKKDIKLTKYWNYRYEKNYDARPKEELIDELGELWQKAVERRIKKDETIIIPLS